MTIELYAAPTSALSGVIELPVSNTTGELPEQEPSLSPNDLLGSFDSREEAIEFITKLLANKNQVVTDSRSVPFDIYSHIEWLTVITKAADQSIHNENYYLVLDEGY